MALWKGQIARSIILMFAVLALIALGMAWMAFQYAKAAAETEAQISYRSDLALLSSQIRSESLLLTGMIQSYTLNVVLPAVGREQIDNQLHSLYSLVNQAQTKIDLKDVDETLQVGEVYQLLIGFNTQARQVLNVFDSEKSYGPLTQAALTVLVEHYQLPLVDSLQRFETLETQKAAALRQQLEQKMRRDTQALIVIALSIVFSALMVVYLITRRFISPLAMLNAGVQKMRSGNLQEHIDLCQEDEIGDLANAINGMAADLEESRRHLQRYALTLEAQVRERTAELHKLYVAIEQSPSLILITDTEGNIEYVNPAFSAITGYSAAEGLGKNPRIIQSGQTSHEQYVALWQTLRKGEVWRGEFHNRKKNGELYWALAVISPIRNEEGQVTHFVAVQQDITARKQAEDELRLWAITDSLTGLYNRRQLFLLTEQALREERRTRQSLCALMMDVDHFKRVNDTYGHSVGDMFLQNVADLLQRNLRQSDVLGRYGGEEFGVVLPNTTLEEAQQIAERIRAQVAEMRVHTTLGEAAVTISIGITVKKDARLLHAERLFDQADQALYQAKQGGRNRVMVFKGETA